MADPILSQLILKRFRSLPAEKVEFDNPTFLVGQNGSGKSNFADAFAFLAEAMASPLQAVLARRGGFSTVGHRGSARGRPSNLGLAVVLKNPDDDTSLARYGFELRPLKDYGFEVVREQCIVQRADGSRSWFDRGSSSTVWRS
jgi:predicted ATPase